MSATDWAWLVAALCIPLWMWLLIEDDTTMSRPKTRCALTEFAAALACLILIWLAAMTVMLPATFGFGLLR